MKTILITGGAGGIARSIIERLMKKYFIYVGVHNMKQLELVGDRYKDCMNIKVIKLDLLSERDIKLVDGLDIDILICNAAIGYGGSIIEIDVNKIREIFEVNVFNNISLIQVVFRNMIKKDSGKIIIMSSLIGLINIPFLGAYSSSKASLIKIAQALRSEIRFLSKNITVHLIEPGMYKTGFNEVMFWSKYKKMDIDSFFKEQVEFIRKRDNFILCFLQRKSLRSITNQLVSCIENGGYFIYSSPFFQRLFAKLYSIINQ